MSKAKQSKTAKKARRVAKAVRKVQKQFSKAPMSITKAEANRLKKRVVITRNKPSDGGVTFHVMSPCLLAAVKGTGNYTEDLNRPYAGASIDDILADVERLKRSEPDLFRPRNVYEWGILTGRRPPVMFRVTHKQSAHFGHAYPFHSLFPIEEVISGRVRFIPLRVGRETLFFGSGVVEECS